MKRRSNQSMGADMLPCSTCGEPIVTHHGRSRFRRRGYGYCCQSCEAAAKSVRADEDTPMRLMHSVEMKHGDAVSCWPFRGRRDPNGYGRLDYKGRPRLAHRMMYELIHCKRLKPDEVVRHSCDNPPCCNPEHLLLGTQADNVKDMWDRGRANRRPSGNRNVK